MGLIISIKPIFFKMKFKFFLIILFLVSSLHASDSVNRGKEIAENINVGKFIERNEVSIQDFLECSRKIIIPETFLPKPIYISPGQSLFTKYEGPKILDEPLDAS